MSSRAAWGELPCAAAGGLWSQTGSGLFAFRASEARACLHVAAEGPATEALIIAAKAGTTPRKVAWSPPGPCEGDSAPQGPSERKVRGRPPRGALLSPPPAPGHAARAPRRPRPRPRARTRTHTHTHARAS